MLSIPFLKELYRHMEWADSKVWGAIVQRNEAVEDSEVCNRLYHSHATQQGFLQLWIEGPVDRYDPSRFPSLSEMYDWAKSYYNNVRDFLNNLDETQLEKGLPVPWAMMFERQLGQKPEPTTLVETMFQVANHTTYHRGQINARLRQLGGEPPLVDYIAWIWGGRPEPEWEVF
ncbi:MAG: DinB family protein [Chlorobi bacterium]|nr:DinB family protein [Chlorobiota bacterium]